MPRGEAPTHLPASPAFTTRLGPCPPCPHCHPAALDESHRSVNRKPVSSFDCLLRQGNLAKVLTPQLPVVWPLFIRARTTDKSQLLHMIPCLSAKVGGFFSRGSLAVGCKLAGVRKLGIWRGRSVC